MKALRILANAQVHEEVLPAIMLFTHRDRMIVSRLGRCPISKERVIHSRSEAAIRTHMKTLGMADQTSLRVQ